MAVSIKTSSWNTTSFSGIFGDNNEAIIVIERDGGDYYSAANAISLGSLPMTLLQYSHNYWLIAFWGVSVPQSLVGQAYGMVRAQGAASLSRNVDIIKLSGVSSSMLYAAHNAYINIGTATSHSHNIATKRGGMLIDYLMTGDAAYPGTGQSRVFSDSRPKSSYKANTLTGLTQMAWTWEPSIANYVCVSIKPKIVGGGARGVL